MDLQLLPFYWLIPAIGGIAWVDERQKRIPNPTLLALLFFQLGMVSLHLEAGQWEGARWLWAGAGLAVFVLLSLLLPHSFGMGDAKLIGILILYLGPLGAGLVVWLAFLFTLLRAIVLRLRLGPAAPKMLAFAPQVAGALLLFYFLSL